MTPKQHAKLLAKEMENRVVTDIVDANEQKTLNSRLDKLYFRFLTAEEFDEKAGEHYDEQISLVLRGGAIELWKGDVRIFLGGGDFINFQLIVQTLHKEE